MRRELIDEADENLAVHTTWVHARVAGMYAMVDEALALADAGLGSDSFNTVCRTRLEVGGVGRIREVVEYFRARGQPFSWWVGPGDTPGHLAELLEGEGLEHAESEIGMAVELEELEDLVDASPPAGFSIARVRSPGQLAAFAEINAGNWSPPDSAVLEFYERARPELLVESCPFWLYLGYVDGAPVATAQLALSGKVAGLYNVSTLPEYRRRGIASAMTFGSLAHACGAGFERAVLQATAEGVGIYQRAGFHVFGEYREFKPPAIRGGK